jgi:2Fe-2S ferredoxin
VKNENVELDVSDGARLLGYAKAQTNMLFGCENGQCGICTCTILRGIENINPRNAAEDNLLKAKSAYPNQRLACQIYVKKGEVEIEY